MPRTLQTATSVRSIPYSMSISTKLSWFFLSLALGAMMSSCGAETPREKEASPSDRKGSEMASEVGNSQGIALYALHVIPQKAYKASTLSLVAEGFLLADARISWKINGMTVPDLSSAKVKMENIKKGDIVHAIAVVHGQEVVSHGVTIADSAPEFKHIRILPESFKPGDTFFVEASASDADGDDITISYEWILNGTSVGNDTSLGLPVKRGDQIMIKLIASDGREKSPPAVLKREIRNFPPIISEDTALQCDTQICSGRIRASDPDGDNLTYTLKKGPQHMNVDSVSGFVTWEIPAAFIGNETVSVAVSDGHDGESIKTFSIDVQK